MELQRGSPDRGLFLSFPSKFSPSPKQEMSSGWEKDLIFFFCELVSKSSSLQLWCLHSVGSDTAWLVIEDEKGDFWGKSFRVLVFLQAPRLSVLTLEAQRIGATV